MRYTHLFALSAAVVLTGALYGVLSGEPTDSPVLEPQREATVHTESPTTEAPIVFSADARSLVPSTEEVESIQAAVEHASTTTTEAPRTNSGSGNSSSDGSTNTTSSPPPPPAAGGEFRSDYESSFSSKINGLRSSDGLAGLTRSGSLNSRARNWAKSMADAGELKHSNLSSLMGTWTAAGENVGKGGSVNAIFNSLKASGGHLQNMLGDFTHVGIGAWVDESGVIWTVHVFAR